MAVKRESISGFFMPDDIGEGEFGAEDLARRNRQQQEEYNRANQADWGKGFTEAGNPALGDAMSREPKPVEVDGNSTADCYGSL